MSEVLDDYRGLVRSIARSAYCSSSIVSFSDLCQIGDIAVLRAISSYDPSCGTNIRSFISHIVRQDIYNEAARFLGVFTVDPRVTRLAAKVNRLSIREFSDEDIAIKLQISCDKVRDLRFIYNQKILPIDELEHNESGHS